MLETLRDMGNLNIRMNSRFSLITIVKYEVYQNESGQLEQQNEQQVNSRRTAGEQQVNTNKNGKNVEEGKEDSPTPHSRILPIDVDRATWNPHYSPEDEG